MGAILDALQQRKTPIRIAVGDRAAQAKPSGTSISVEEKCELLEMLRLGMSYKEARTAFKVRTGKDVKERSLARWAAEAVHGKGASIAERIEDRRPARSGRGGCVEGGFKVALVDHLNRNFTTWKHLHPDQCWCQWQLVEIRFWLVFGVLPVRVSLFDAEFRNQSLVNVAGDADWAEWYDQQITTRLAGGDLDSGVQDLLDAVSRAFPSFEPMAHKGKLKFCERSIRDGLRAGGYVESNPRKRQSTSPLVRLSAPVWVKATGGVQDGGQTEVSAVAGEDTPSSAPETESVPMPKEGGAKQGPV